jgi:hypothetical protein
MYAGQEACVRLININYDPLRRSQKALQEARRAQYLPEDIRMAQRYIGLEQQGLELQGRRIDLQGRQADLQRETVNFNKGMWLANTIVAGVGASASAVRAGIDIYNAFDGYAKQQEIELLNQAKSELEEQISKDILSGDTRMTTNEHGELIYTGLTPEAAAIRARYEERIRNEMGGAKRGNAGRAVKSLNQTYSDLNVGAVNMMGDKTYRDAQNKFQTNMQTSIQEFIKTGDRSLFEQTMEQAKGWMSEEVWNQYKENAEKEMAVGRAANIAMSIAQRNGMDAAKEFLDGQDLTEDQKSQIFSKAQQASSQAATAAVTAARETYAQSKKNGMTTGDAYRSAIAGQGENQSVNEAIKKTAQEAQYQDLSNDFEEDMAGSDSMTVDELKQLRKKYENLRSNYQDQGMLYRQHLERINNKITGKEEIARREGAAAAGGGRSEAAVRQDAENVMANLYVQFNNKEISGPAAIAGINNLREISPLRALEYEIKMLGGGESPAAQQTYRALDAIIKRHDPGTTANAEQRIEYDTSAENARQAIFQAYFNGVRGEQLAQLVEGYRQEMASEVLQRAFREGTIGNTGLLGRANDTATAFAYHSARGSLDLRYSERTLDARNPGQTTPITAGGENAEKVMIQAAENNRAWANRELSKRGIDTQLTTIDYSRDESGDRDGTVRYLGSDSYYYRVNADRENGDRYLERWIGGRWVKIERNTSSRVFTGAGTVR